MAGNCRLAIDAMGGDIGPRVTVPATCEVLAANPNISAVLLGDRDAIQPELANQPSSASGAIADRVTLVHCEHQVAMQDKPADAIRSKRDSSLKVGLDMLAGGEADAFVSAGNTGALVAMSVIGVGTMEGISRPAICTSIPTRNGHAYLLDMGANPVCSAEQLHQFALFATHMCTAMEGRKNPSVGLLNIGVEAIKGTREIKDAAELIENDPRLNYVGFVEGDGLFSGCADIVVCDGFSGNIALKSIEGAARMIAALLKESLEQSLLSRMGATLLKPGLKKFGQKVNPELYNGACLLGLKKVVIKSHGSASQRAFERALYEAARQVEHNVPANL